MSSRPYRRFEGVCYPNVLRGKSRPQQVKASLESAEEFYHDEAIKLRDGDVEDFIGQNICVEHDTDFVVGTISDAWVDSMGHMRATGRVYTDSQEGRDLFDAIISKDMRSLSVNYKVPMDNNNKTYGYKVPKEISVVKDPFFEGAEICVAASANRSKERATGTPVGGNSCISNPSSSVPSSDGLEIQNYKSNLNPVGVEKKVIQLEIMAEEIKKPVEEKEKESGLLERHDELLKQLQQMQKEKIALLEKASRADELEKLERQRREQYALDQQPILKEVLDIQAEQLKEQFGADYKMPAEYVQALSETFAAPEAKDNAAIIVASAKAYKKAQDDKKKFETQLMEMNDKITKLSQDQSASSLYFDALKRQQMITDIPNPSPAKEVSIEASGGKKFKSMFIPTSAAQPSPQERDLYQRATGKTLDVNVVASSTGFAKPLPPVPNHNQEHLLPNSMRHNKTGGAGLFSLLVNQSYEHIQTPTTFRAEAVKEDE